MSPWVITRKGERIWSGPPPGTPGQIYVLCFGQPRRLKAVDFDSRYPVSHYVGITWRTDPRKRLYEHGRGVAKALVEWRHGDEEEERRVKIEELCPRCGRALDYRAEIAALRAAIRRQHRRTSDREAVRQSERLREQRAVRQARQRQIWRTSARSRVLLGLRRAQALRRMTAERAAGAGAPAGHHSTRHPSAQGDTHQHADQQGQRGRLPSGPRNPL